MLWVMSVSSVEVCQGNCGPAVPNIDARVALLKALADPVRLQIVARVASSGDESVCACSMPDIFGISQPTLSYHLKKLVDANVLRKEMRGNWAHFSVREETLIELAGFFTELGAQEVSMREPCGDGASSGLDGA